MGPPVYQHQGARKDDRCISIRIPHPEYVPGSLSITALPPLPSPRASPHARG